jgi:hypothetical protein
MDARNSHAKSKQVPQYLDIEERGGAGWSVMVWDDPAGELCKIQGRLDSGEVFTSVSVQVTEGRVQRVECASPVVVCRLRPLELTRITGTVQSGPGERMTFLPE